MPDNRTSTRRATVNWDAARRAFGSARVDEYLRTRDPSRWDVDQQRKPVEQDATGAGAEAGQGTAA